MWACKVDADDVDQVAAKWYRIGAVIVPLAVIALVIEARASRGDTIDLSAADWACAEERTVERTSMMTAGKIPVVKSQSSPECTAYVRKAVPRK